MLIIRVRANYARTSVLAAALARFPSSAIHAALCHTSQPVYRPAQPCITLKIAPVCPVHYSALMLAQALSPANV